MTQLYGTLNSGYKIPLLGLGTIIGMGSKVSENQNEVQDAIKAAIEIGFRHIDTASMYKNETRIGEALKVLFASGKIKREDIFITSKLANDCKRPEDARACIQQCLADLQVSYLDLFLLHYPLAVKHGVSSMPKPGEAPPLLELDRVPVAVTWKAMEGFVKEGLTKSIGVSNFSGSLLHDLVSSAEIKPAVNQIELHPYLQQQHLLEYCRMQDIHVTAYAPLLRGLGYSPLWFSGEYPPKLSEEPVIQSLAKKHGRTPGQIVLRWGIQRGPKGEAGGVSVIPKASNPAHLRENFAILDAGFSLSEEDITQIATLERHYRTNKGLAGGVPVFE